MKRYIRSGWYVGEPDTYDKKTGRSYYSNPKDWKDKLEAVKQVLEPFEDVLELGSRSSWGCNIDEVSPKGEHWPTVYKFDYWEDKKPFDEQLEDFWEIAQDIYSKHHNGSIWKGTY